MNDALDEEEEVFSADEVVEEALPLVLGLKIDVFFAGGVINDDFPFLILLFLGGPSCSDFEPAAEANFFFCGVVRFRCSTT